MTDIFPAEDQPIGDVITELTKLGLVEGQDFKLHFTWDMKPFVQAEPGAYKKWQRKHGGDDESDKDTAKSSASKESSSTSSSTSSSSDDDSKGSTARKRGGK